MASNFKITTHRNGENIHIILKGDFDGNSAWELFHFLNENSKRRHSFIINAKGLNNIFSFGVQTFCQLMKELKRNNTYDLVTGDKIDKILSETDMLIGFNKHHNKSNLLGSEGRG